MLTALFHLRTAHFVHRNACHGDDVKAVVADLGLGQRFAHSLALDPIDGAATVNLPYTVTDAAGKTASASLSVGFASSEIATVPTLSEMALLLLMLLMVGSGWTVLRRR